MRAAYAHLRAVGRDEHSTARRAGRRGARSEAGGRAPATGDRTGARARACRARAARRLRARRGRCRTARARGRLARAARRAHDGTARRVARLRRAHRALQRALLSRAALAASRRAPGAWRFALSDELIAADLLRLRWFVQLPRDELGCIALQNQLLLCDAAPGAIGRYRARGLYADVLALYSRSKCAASVFN